MEVRRMNPKAWRAFCWEFVRMIFKALWCFFLPIWGGITLVWPETPRYEGLITIAVLDLLFAAYSAWDSVHPNYPCRGCDDPYCHGSCEMLDRYNGELVRFGYREETQPETATTEDAA